MHLCQYIRIIHRVQLSQTLPHARLPPVPAWLDTRFTASVRAFSSCLCSFLHVPLSRTLITRRAFSRSIMAGTTKIRGLRTSFQMFPHNLMSRVTPVSYLAKL